MAGSGLVRESPFKPLGEETASKFKKSQSIFEAYGAGIEAVTGTSWTPPTSKSELDAMGNLTRTYGRVGGTRDGSLLEGEALFSWLTTIAKAYATATQEAWRFQRGYAPSKCAEWLMAGSPVAIPTTAHRASGRSAPTQPSDLGKIENPWGGMDTDDDCFDSRGRYIGRRRQTTQEAAE